MSGSGAPARRKAARSEKVLKVRSLFFFWKKRRRLVGRGKDEMFKCITEQRKEGRRGGTSRKGLKDEDGEGCVFLTP